LGKPFPAVNLLPVFSSKSAMILFLEKSEILPCKDEIPESSQSTAIAPCALPLFHASEYAIRSGSFPFVMLDKVGVLRLNDADSLVLPQPRILACADSIAPLVSQPNNLSSITAKGFNKPTKPASSCPQKFMNAPPTPSNAPFQAFTNHSIIPATGSTNILQKQEIIASIKPTTML
jgi:hypothetical protein